MSKILANEIANYGDNAPIDLKEGLNIPAGKPLQAAGSAGSSGQILSSTGTSISWITPFDGSYNSLTNRPTIPAAQINSDWNASSGVAVILNKPSVPPLPSVTTASASGGGSLAYNSSNGQFTFTPADLSNASNWDTAFGWGDHSTAGYLTAETDTLGTVVGRGNNTGGDIVVSDNLYLGGTGSSSSHRLWISSNDIVIQNSQTGGRNISTAQSGFRVTGGLYSNTLLDVGGSVSLYKDSGLSGSDLRLQTTSYGIAINGSIEMGSGNITTTGKLLYANNYDNLGDLPGASTYHGMFAHVHGTGKGYFAHAGAWTELLDVNSSMADLGDVDLTVAPTDGQVLKWEQSSGSWKAANDLTGGGGGGLALTDLSASNATASGGGSLSYNSGSGAFTFTPPDLSSFLTTETDPVFSASDAAAVTAAGIANWNSAYSWGNHAAQGYLVGYGGVSNHTDVSITGVQNGQLLQYNGSNWVNVTPSYISSYTETDTLDSVLERGDSSARNIQILDGGELRLGTGSDYCQIWSNNSNTFYIRNTLGTGAGGDIYYQSRTGHHFYSGGTAAGNNCLSLTGSGICTLKYLGSDRLVTTAAGVTVTGAVTATSFVKSGGTSSQYLMADGSVTTGGGGGGGASVTISDTAPAASAGDLWWESDTGRLKIYYQDTDSTQWVDTSPPLRFDNIDDIVTANGFKFRTNPSSPPAGTLGELRQINGKPYFYDGTTWQEFIFANAAVTTIPAETDWDQVLIRSNFDNDANDFKFSATGDLQHYSGIIPATLTASPSVFGTNSLRCTGNGVKYTHRSEYDFTGTWTIEFWIYFDSAGGVTSGTNNGEQQIVSKCNAGESAGSWSISTASDAFGNRSWRFKYNDVATNVTDYVFLENIAGVSWSPKYLNTWVHVAFTRDSNGALHLYTNGFESDSTKFGSTYVNDIDNNSYDICIGGGQATSTNTFDGYIDDLRITKDVRYVSEGQSQTQVFTPPTSAHPVSGSTTTFTPPPTSKAGEIALGASPTWTGTLGVTVTQQSSGNYRMSFTNPFANASDYYVIANHLDGSGPVDLVSVRSAGHVDFAVTQSGSNVDTGSISVQVIAH